MHKLELSLFPNVLYYTLKVQYDTTLFCRVGEVGIFKLLYVEMCVFIQHLIFEFHLLQFKPYRPKLCLKIN
jgi:hypothetical protein